MINKNIKQRIQGLMDYLVVYSTLIVPIGLCTAQAIVGNKDVRERVAYTTYEPGPTIGDNIKYVWGVNHSISGFDRNNDGLIDEIKVQALAICGKFMPAINSRTYNSQDKEFSELKEILREEN